ncbi:MAG: hypothetical protein RR201_00020 [Malacoplasma sp.]
MIKKLSVKKVKSNGKKFNYNLIWYFLILLIPLFSLSFVLAPAKGSDLINYFTTYDNALDMSLALGIAPDYDTTSSAGKIKYANYLKPYVNENMTQFENVSIMDGGEVNRPAISKLKANTIALNEWMRADAHKFKDVINDIVYTSMGDSNEANYNDDVIYTQGSWKYNYSVSVSNAFLMMSKGLDAIYTNEATKFYNKANDIINLQIQRIKSIQEKNKNTIIKDKINGKTLGFIYTRASNIGQILSSTVSIYAPSVYPFLYSKKVGRGIGFEFPAPRDAGFENITHYKTHDIRATSFTDLIAQFKNKFDYLVIMASDTSTITKQEAISSEMSTLLKGPAILNQNVVFGSAGDWYTNSWGIIGVWDLLNKFSEWFKLDQDLATVWKPYLPSDLKKIRKYYS